MRKLVLFASLFLNIFCLSAQTFTEMLSRPTDHTITVSIVFNTPVETYLEYGSKTGVYGSSTVMDTSVLNETVETLLSGLQPETRYYYRTRYRKIGDLVFLAGTEHTFMTQRKKGSPFVFTIESDPHPYDPKGYHPLWDISLQNQLKDGADFMLDLGDTFGDDHKVTTITSAQVQQLMLDNLPHFGGVCHSMPLYFCLGNHEGENGYFLLQTPPNNMAVYETRWRKMYYPNPFPDGFYTGNSTVENFGMDKPQNYFSWEWGDALFVVIDGWRYYTTSAKPRNWDWTIGETQYKWLKKTLEYSTAKFKIVFTHHVMGETRGGIGVANQYEWGGYDGNGKNLFTQYRPGWEMPIHQLMVKNNV
ncbi:MAG: metallophosphoesterase, partial [Bacteroidia bacterium]|nr:metallophosphoesterase [Bacteroidia bacterium]